MGRPAPEVADIFRIHGPSWREVQRGHLSLAQLKVMSAITQCRTAALGGHVYQLGVRYSANNGSLVSNYVYCQCDGSGLACQCHDLPAAGEPLPAQATLLADPAAGTLTIQVGSQTVYRFQP